MLYDDDQYFIPKAITSMLCDDEQYFIPKANALGRETKNL
jgi:hypothetical protein